MPRDWNAFLTSSAPEHAITDGNRIQHLWHDNRAVYAIWDAIEAAGERVWVTMYTLAPDEVGRGTLERLTDAAGRGCDVRLLYDYIGSLALGQQDLAPLLAAGGRVAVFNRIWPPWKKNGRLGIRNHRKLVLIDNDVGFCGGMNLSEDFAGDDFGEWVFDDTVVRLDGPCVLDLMGVFARTWREMTEETLSLPPRGTPYADGCRVEVLETDPRRPETRLIEVLGGAIRHAAARCQITTPYFIPAPWLMDALLQALRNGADVRILTAGRSDAALARLAGRSCYEQLMEHGARIFEMFGRIIHTKTLSIDGAFCAVGSYNFDLWTSRHVLDVSVATVDEDLARSFERELEDDLEHSEEITPEAWKKRSPLHKAAYWAALQICKHV